MKEAVSYLNAFIPPRNGECYYQAAACFLLSLSTGDVGILPLTHPIRQELFLFIKLIQ